jgi:hypothetical protein
MPWKAFLLGQDQVQITPSKFDLYVQITPKLTFGSIYSIQLFQLVQFTPGKDFVFLFLNIQIVF